MSPETGRVPVPTNGKGPHPPAEAPMAAEPAEPEEASLAFTPAQLAIGFGIIASLVVLLAGRLRNRRRSGRR
jgi:hypothetical protein